MGIRIENLHRKFGERTAVNGLTLNVKPGEIMGLLGPNGAGKSTTMRILTGGIAPTSGMAYVNGLPVAGSDTSWRKNLGYLPEQNPLYPEMYVYEYLQHVARLYGLPKPRQEAQRVAELTGLTRERTRRIGVLSKGYRQRVGLAAALIGDPRTLILDEPTNGLDPNQIVEIRRVIRDVGSDRAVLLSTHIMQEVEALCDTVAIISQGTLMAQGPTSQVVSQRNARTFIIGFATPIDPDRLRVDFPHLSIDPLPGNEFALHATDATDHRPALYAYAVDKDLPLLTLYERESHLEDVFRSLTHA